MGLTNPGRALGRSCLLSISPKLLTLSGIPPFSTNLFQLASVLALLVGLNLSFVIGALAWFFKITKIATFESVEVLRKDPFLALFSLYISDVLVSLLFSVSCSLYADDLAIGSPPKFSTAVGATQRALIRLECWVKYWCLPLNPSKCEASFFSVDPHQAILISNLTSSYLTPAFILIPLQLFLESPTTTLFPFFKDVSLLKTKFFSRLKILRCSSASS